MLLTQYDLRTSFSSPREEGARATSDKQRATDFEECPSVGTLSHINVTENMIH